MAPTTRSMEPGAAPEPAVAVTALELLVAENNSSESALPAVVASVARDATLLLSPCSAEIVDWTVDDWFFSRVCGIASTCIS